uniref:Ovule protein n=1 Tax=Steinernema glaseri TaxID=37863 RepID=A0A1I7ZRL8_9BILA
MQTRDYFRDLSNLKLLSIPLCYAVPDATTLAEVHLILILFSHSVVKSVYGRSLSTAPYYANEILAP